MPDRLAEAAWISDSDLGDVKELLAQVKVVDTDDVHIVDGTRIVLWNSNDYPVGALVLEEGQWRFEVHDDRLAEV